MFYSLYKSESQFDDPASTIAFLQLWISYGDKREKKILSKLIWV